jgi:hypothetical protein
LTIYRTIFDPTRNGWKLVTATLPPLVESHPAYLPLTRSASLFPLFLGCITAASYGLSRLQHNTHTHTHTHTQTHTHTYMYTHTHNTCTYMHTKSRRAKVAVGNTTRCLYFLHDYMMIGSLGWNMCVLFTHNRLFVYLSLMTVDQYASQKSGCCLECSPLSQVSIHLTLKYVFVSKVFTLQDTFLTSN